MDALEVPQGALGPIAMLVAIIAALRAAGMPKKWSPLAALVLGVILAFFAPGPVASPTVLDELDQGLLLALGAVGAHSASKNLLQAFRASGEKDAFPEDS